ncbi:Zn-finger [Geosmithia morbida]|uniref:Zn-finger n=1 Tax=Geosmithia morbida TaxID=1094350 RepID=A0A9P5D5K2_9HYPO|nr:Zn-finger [Geosmithia morbida]KAF4124636.1 Zn-finger [Geosmithia morbida]
MLRCFTDFLLFLPTLNSKSMPRPVQVQTLEKLLMPIRQSSDIPSMAFNSFGYDPRGLASSLTPPDSSDASGHEYEANTTIAAGAGDNMSPGMPSIQPQNPGQGQGQHNPSSNLGQPHYSFAGQGQGQGSWPASNSNSFAGSPSPIQRQQQTGFSQYESRPPMYSQPPLPASTYALPSPTHTTPPAHLQQPRTFDSMASPYPGPPPPPMHNMQQHMGHHQQPQPMMAPPAPYRNHHQSFYPPMPLPQALMHGGGPHNGGAIPMHPGAMHMGQQYMYPSTSSQMQDRPFKCDTCVQSFSRNHDLKRHKRIHLSVKPFPCSYCGKQFSRKDALKRHRLVKGCEEKEKEREKDKLRLTGQDGGPEPTEEDDGVSVINGGGNPAHGSANIARYL